MSLLDNGPHTLTVQRMKNGPVDRYNRPTRIPDGGAVIVTGALVSPLSTEESLANGVAEVEAYKVRCRVWPGGPYSQITWDSRTWSQRGPTRRASAGNATRNQSAILVADSTEVM